MAPLAGKPPFATDEPDSFYESSPAPQRRIRPPAPPNPNARTSAYNVYDNYLGPGDSHAASASNRQSGAGALGMGLLNMSDSEDESDDEASKKPPPSDPSKKNAALAAATAAAWTAPPRSSSKNVMNQDPRPFQPPTIVAPQPGYAAPIAALNLARPENITTRAPPPKPIAVPTLQNPFEPPMAQAYNPYRAPFPNSPSPSGPPSSPHPLEAPITPITPVFARPGKVAFSDPIPRNKPIMRSGTEDALPTRRGETGDDFWRRFSMVAKENMTPNGSKDSWWLKKTQSGTSRLSRWVWIIGIILVLCIIGASIIGWKVSQSNPNHGPTAFGGSANELSSATTAPTPTDSSTIKHVSPTFTVERRGPLPTAIPRGHAKRVHERRKRLFDAVVAH